jgi:hypothetical protein
MRADTIAACASAVGAIASAVAAVYALSFLSHQEDIARNQLQATYFTNLYTKQYENFSSLQTALVAFSSFIGHDEVVSETAGVVRFDNKYKERLDSRYAELKRVSVDVIERLQAFDIISPRSLRPFLTPPEEWVNTVESGFVDLKNKTTPEQASSLRAIILRVAQNMFVWKDHIFPCIDNILSTGQPITDSGIAVCNIPSPDDWGRSTN